MHAYGVVANVSCGTDLPIINITGSASMRLKLYEYILGFAGTPDDVATELVLERTTAVGTGGTSLTPEPLDPLTQAAVATAKRGTFSAAPTDAAELMGIAINQRATHRWIAREGAELVSVAAANNGIMLNCETSGATPTVKASLYWME